MSLKNTILIYLVLTLCPLFAQSLSGTQEDWAILPPQQNSFQPAPLSHEEEKLLTNVASKAFTWITGDLGQARYEPIGELANYFGFAKLRNEIRDGSDNPLADENFRGSSWIVVMENLDSEQRHVLYDLADRQASHFFGFLDTRVMLIDGLYSLKDNNPLDKAQLSEYIRIMGEREAAISLLSAESYGRLIPMLTPAQKTLFADIRAGRSAVGELKGQGEFAEEANREMKGFSAEKTDLLTEIASKFLSYETGSLEDAVFLPSGKIGNFFGFASYRYEDRAKVSRSQAAELIMEVLRDDQKEILRSLTRQIYPLQQSYIESRAALIKGSYPLKSGTEVNGQALLDSYLAGAMAEGWMGINQAIYFDYLERSLRTEQIEKLKSLRQSSSNASRGQH